MSIETVLSERIDEFIKQRSGPGVITDGDGYFAICLKESSPRKREFVRKLNDREDARRRKETVLQNAIEVEMEQILKDIEANGDAPYQNSRWLAGNLRTLQALMLENYPAAYARATESLKEATEPFEKAASHHNASGACIRGGDPYKAIQHSLAALEVDSSVISFWAHLAEATFKARRTDWTGRIFEAQDPKNPGAWAAIFKHDPVFREISEDVPACRDFWQKAQSYL